MGIKFANFATSTIANVGGIAAGDLALSVASGDGNAKFPALSAGDYFYCVLVDPSANREVIKVTVRSGDDFTITRAQDGTSARSFSQGDKVELRLNQGALEELRDIISSSFSETPTAIDAAAAFIDALSATQAQVDHAATELDGHTVGGTSSGDILDNVSPKILSNLVLGATGVITTGLLEVVGPLGSSYIAQMDNQGGSRKYMLMGLHGGGYGLLQSYDVGAAAYINQYYRALAHFFEGAIATNSNATVAGTLGVTGKSTLSGGINDGSSDLGATFAEVDDRCDGYPHEYSSENASQVVVDTGLLDWDTITTVDLGSVTAGDRITVHAYVQGGKGVTAGTNSIRVIQGGGTATIAFVHDLTGVMQKEYCLASEDGVIMLSSNLKITGSGTLVLSLDGREEGSAWTVYAGLGQLYAIFDKKQ